jgi:hypothetical protein
MARVLAWIHAAGGVVNVAAAAASARMGSTRERVSSSMLAWVGRRSTSAPPG